MCYAKRANTQSRRAKKCQVKDIGRPSVATSFSLPKYCLCFSVSLFLSLDILKWSVPTLSSTSTRLCPYLAQTLRSPNKIMPTKTKSVGWKTTTTSLWTKSKLQNRGIYDPSIENSRGVGIIAQKNEEWWK